MKISLDSRINYHAETVNSGKSLASTTTTEASGKNYDAITIQSDQRQIAEKTFSAALSQKISAAVRTENGENRVETIKEQVQNGAYTMNHDVMASRILLLQGGSFHA